ncbi:MarR family winged helix-turn-helix transcriptional regulator [Bosea sp. TAF32]|uniref:MarR family winged helix-turn-helix transcriptional regulator n=1 Tax=Bosea sp. TAF32 TaxID=3237482 RepID=UPI003F91DC77
MLDEIADIADLRDKPGFLIRRAHQITVADIEAKLAAYKVTAPQHLVLTVLYLHPKIDQATLADLIALDRVTVGRILVGLERRNLVRRDRSRVDARARVLSLSTPGKRLVLALQDAVRRSQTDILAPLSDEERGQFFHIMRRLVGFEPPASIAALAAETPEQPAGGRVHGP